MGVGALVLGGAAFPSLLEQLGTLPQQAPQVTTRLLERFEPTPDPRLDGPRPCSRAACSRTSARPIVSGFPPPNPCPAEASASSTGDGPATPNSACPSCRP